MPAENRINEETLRGTCPSPSLPFALFEKHGLVRSHQRPETGRPSWLRLRRNGRNGFAKAIQALNGYEMDGRALMVNEAQDKPRRDGGGGGDRGGRSGGGRGGNRGGW
jgi:hypothetical protein